jgi:hypothetical protein
MICFIPQLTPLVLPYYYHLLANILVTQFLYLSTLDIIYLTCLIGIGMHQLDNLDNRFSASGHEALDSRVARGR